LLPNGDPGSQEGLYLNPSMFFSIASTSKAKYQAAKFIDFFTNDVEANKVLAAERGVPISSKVREALLPTLDDSSKQMFNYIADVEKHSSKIDPPDPAGAAEVSTALKNIEDEILFNKITPEAAAAKFRKQANDILSKQ
jgi:multiple sugar transport system substrate-binding protein